jgi:hypothetical protein
MRRLSGFGWTNISSAPLVHVISPETREVQSALSFVLIARSPRHHRAKKNVTDNAQTAAHIRGRDVIGFAAATVALMRPYLEKGGHSAETVQRMQDAWWKSMILQVTLWSQPYMNPGDF